MARRKKWRLYQILVASGIVKSKYDAAMLARAGKITVDGKIMESLHYQVNPFKADVRVNGKKVELKENRRYFVLNKPEGIETTKENMFKFLKGKVSVEILYSFAPVGRLDKDTTGLLILTNDGKLARKVLDPKTKRYKTYVAFVEGKISEEDCEKLRKGVKILVEDEEGEHEYTTLPAKAIILKSTITESELEISIFEGKKRQIKKMCKAVGHAVKKLKRISIAKLELGALKSGEVEEYSKEEIYRLLFE